MSTVEVAENSPLLTVENLVVEYPSKKFRAKPFRALTDINISIGQGETLGLVGESGWERQPWAVPCLAWPR